jgi:hypothetical protein
LKKILNLYNNDRLINRNKSKIIQIINNNLC